MKASFERLGFKNVVSYINSGNIAFDVRVSSPHVSKGSSHEEKLIFKIEKAIEKDFGLNVQVVVREQSAIDDVLANNPFEGKFESHKEMHVLFLKSEMPADKEKLLLEKQTADEQFVVRGREIFCHLRLGVADSLLGKGFIEKKLKVIYTGRNWRTVQKLVEL